ncbi:MAG: TraB/GumN family protein [Amphritea sp.]
MKARVFIERLLIVSMLCLFTQFSNAASSVWKVSKDGYELYLGGTIHLLRAEDYPLPVEFNFVYQRASKLIFETDLAQLMDPAVQQRMQQALMYQDGTTLKQKVSAGVYAQISEKWQAAGMPPTLLDIFRPGGVVMTLTLVELKSAGVNAEGIDMHFFQRASQDNKSVAGLESVEKQIEYLARMGEGVEDEFMRQSLIELEQSSSFMGELVAAWRSGDQDALEQMIISDMRTQFPKIYASLLVERNLLWMPQIKQMLKDRQTELVLVGMGHLVGPDGLLQKLLAQGYQIEQVRVSLSN